MPVKTYHWSTFKFIIMWPLNLRKQPSGQLVGGGQCWLFPSLVSLTLHRKKMSVKRKCTDGSSVPKKKTKQYLERYIDFGFMEGLDSFRPECVICGEKLANQSMKPCKLKRHQETKHPETIGESREYFERKKQLALSRRSTDIRKAFEKAGTDFRWRGEWSRRMHRALPRWPVKTYLFATHTRFDFSVRRSNSLHMPHGLRNQAG